MTAKELIEKLTKCLDGVEDRLVFIVNDSFITSLLTDCFVDKDGVIIVSSVYSEEDE